MILRNYKRFILHNVNCNQDIQVQIRSERNVYETASGRLLVAYLSEKERERFLQYNGLPEESMWEEASTVEGLVNELSKIRLSGIAMTNFAHTHLVGFAVPIHANGKVILGLITVRYYGIRVIYFSYTGRTTSESIWLCTFRFAEAYSCGSKQPILSFRRW